MNIPLIQGEFSNIDALDLITNMIKIKLKYHEDKINQNASEEDIKTRESKIKSLQNELSEFRATLSSKQKSVKIEAIIKIE